MSFTKNYTPGKIHMDLPTSNYIHELPLFSFADIHGALNLSLIFNYRMKQERGNLFHIMAGYKLNLQKRLIMENSAPKMLLEEDGKCTEFISTGGVYVLDNADQRILRHTGSNYTLKNMDFSEEIYDPTGKIVSAYDKYNNLVLSYGYDTSGRLTSITYRNSKTVSFTYSGNQLTSISYAGCTTTLAYATNKITVSHYSGMRYTLSTSVNTSSTSSDLPWMDFSAVANDPNNTSIAAHTTTAARSNDNTVVISYKIGSNVVDTMSYYFSYPVEYSSKHHHVEVANKTGVKTRYQYQGGILRCAYEVNGSDVTFNGNQYEGNVQLYKTMDEEDNSQASGPVAFQDGAPMTSSNNGNRWTYDVDGNIDLQAAGYYLLTGWIRDANTTINAGDSLLRITSSGMESGAGSDLTFEPDLMPGQKWTFFAYKFYLPANRIYVDLGNTGCAKLKDLRLAFYSPNAAYGRYTYHVDVTEDILITHNTSEPEIISVAGCTFSRGSMNISAYGIVSFADLLKYKINQRKGLNTTEFYCNQGKKVLTAYPSAQVTVTDAGGITRNLSNCYLGQRQHTRNGTVITRIVDNDTSKFLIFETSKENGTTISSQVLNNYLDVVSATNDGVTTTYTRNKDLVTGESVSNLYSRATAYSTDSSGNPLITVTDEFSKITKYTLDPTWGNVKLVILPDNTRITDTYDDDRCTLTKRAFGSTSGRSITHTYSGGNLSGLQSGDLTYGFSYTNGKLTSVTKNSAQVEAHTHTDTTTNSYYPTQTNALHSSLATFDKYGRLTSISGVLTNTYAVAPAFNSSGTQTSSANNGSALLATSIDEFQGKTTRFTYNDKELLTKKEVTAKSSYATKVSVETFEYDKQNRLTDDDFTYNQTSGKKVSTTITYVDAEDKPNADSRISKYTYAVIGSGTAVTNTTYDAYKRPKTKSYKIAGKTFTRTATYQKTRLDYATDSAGGTTNVDYDDCGSVRMVTAGGQGTKYTYDQYGQLVREDNQPLAKTFVYAYNNNGNITSVQAYAYTTGTISGTPVTTSFGYSADKLTSFGGSTIGYNTMGCPTSYDGKTANWSKGRLARLSKGSLADGTESYLYSYNTYGQRISKSYSYLAGTSGMNPVVSGQLTASSKQFYYDHAGRLIAETISKTFHGQGSVSENIVFLYDEGMIIGMEHTAGGTTSSYYFHRNPLGDVVGIYNTSGTLVAKYLYDAWGNCTIASVTTNYTVANANPIRYRGYYYDDDTGLYYCSARYYSPKWRRFISPDDTAYLDPESVNGLNLYCYCGNNPVNYCDPSGHLGISLTILGLIIGSAICATAGGIISYNVAKDQCAEGWELFAWTVAGIVGGGILGGALGAGAGALATQATGILGFSVVNGHIFTVTETMVLGHYGYAALATSLGYGYYQVSDKLYNSMAPAERWAMNSQFLADCAKLGANFIVEATRTISPLFRGNISYLYYEIQYLMERGYIWLEDLSALIK